MPARAATAATRRPAPAASGPTPRARAHTTRTLTNGSLRLQLPDPATARPAPIVIGIVAGVLIFQFKWSVLRVLGVATGLGLLAALASLPGI